MSDLHITEKQYVLRFQQQSISPKLFEGNCFVKYSVDQDLFEILRENVHVTVRIFFYPINI